jgi:hypothetical protein
MKPQVVAHDVGGRVRQDGQMTQTTGTQTTKLSRRFKLVKGAGLMIAALAIAAIPSNRASATECHTQWQYQGNDWFAAYSCYMRSWISSTDNCVENSSGYYIVTVYCGELAVVEVTA